VKMVATPQRRLLRELRDSFESNIKLVTFSLLPSYLIKNLGVSHRARGAIM